MKKKKKKVRRNGIEIYSSGLGDWNWRAWRSGRIVQSARGFSSRWNAERSAKWNAPPGLKLQK